MVCLAGTYPKQNSGGEITLIKLTPQFSWIFCVNAPLYLQTHIAVWCQPRIKKSWLSIWGLLLSMVSWRVMVSYGKLWQVMVRYDFILANWRWKLVVSSGCHPPSPWTSKAKVQQSLQGNLAYMGIYIGNRMTLYGNIMYNYTYRDVMLFVMF